MNERIQLFVTLGQQLKQQANSPQFREVVDLACRENPWFTPEEIHRSIHALQEEMLQEERLKEWLSNYEIPSHIEPQNILVIMAGNIPLVGFFDMLCVVITGHRCLVKPSSKDRVLMEYIMQILHEIKPDVLLEVYDSKRHIDSIIATGSDNAERYFKTHYAGIKSLLRGTRQSVAVLRGDESEEELQGLADDIWAYSGLGCRNVSMIFAPKGFDFELYTPEMNPKYRNNYLQTKALLTMNNRPFRDWGDSLATEGKEFPRRLSEVVINRYQTLSEVEGWLKIHDREIQCVVSKTKVHPRCVALGKAQSPRLEDYPDNIDIINWILNK